MSMRLPEYRSMLRAGLLFALGLLFSLQAGAVTLGDLVIRSEPGEPLKAAIPFTLKPDESLAELRVVAASAEEYALQKLERPVLLEGMQIALFAAGELSGRVQLFGSVPWQGEEAILLLNISWPQGQMSRRFRIAPLQPAAEQAGTPLYVEVGENESLDTVALRLGEYSNRSYRHMMVALYRANPDAFFRDNINNLKGGATLRVPSTEELYRLSDAEVTATLNEHKLRWEQERRQDEQARAEEKELQQRMEQVTRERGEIEERNRELRERLARLEKNMSSVTRKVLDYEPVPPSGSKPAQPPEVEAAPVDATEDKAEETKDKVSSEAAEQSDSAQEKSGEGSFGWLLLLAILVMSAAAYLIWRFAPRPEEEA